MQRRAAMTREKADADPDRGLSSEEAARRLAAQGPNSIETEQRNVILRFLAYFWGPIPWMLEAACVLAGVVRRWEEFGVVGAMLLINGAVGWWHESRADKAVAALKEQLAPAARVLRDGGRTTVDARELVVGDVVIVRRGDLVPADAKILEGSVSIDESALTGESLPLDKSEGDPLFSSTAVDRGEAKALVTATGASTRFGRTVELVARGGQRSHFQIAVMRIGYVLMGATAVLAVAVVAVTLVRGMNWTDVLVFALVLTVAGIPVALPAVLSVTMAVGARRLAGQKAIVSRLAAMEELAGVEVLLSDKTGTLTRNTLELQEPVLIAATDAHELVLAAALTSDRDEPDPIDRAVLAAVDEAELRSFEVEDFQPFDSTRKQAEARVSRDGHERLVAKGAPQVLLARCEADAGLRQRVASEVDALADSGFRALGVASSEGQGWRYLGLLSLLDPPRDDSAQIIARARDHGIEVRMVTGDHEAIARQVASQIGLGERIELVGDWLEAEGDAPELSADGFAEVTPEDKYRLVERYQRRGQIVAMTGDGVNDAPALERADVGFAVAGATEAARAAADIVLTEPGLGVIVEAIEEARRIFTRMRHYSTFRVAETSRMLLFIGGTVLFLGIYPVTAVMVALLAILNDIPIMMIASDNVATPVKPARWNLRWVLADASLLGVAGVTASFLLLWFAKAFLSLPIEQLQTLLFLKLLVAGHMTLYVTRARGWFWIRPWPSWRLVVALESTQVLGTLAAIFGWLVAAIPWWLALVVWGYAIVWMFLLSGVRVLALRWLWPEMRARARG